MLFPLWAKVFVQSGMKPTFIFQFLFPSFSGIQWVGGGEAAGFLVVEVSLEPASPSLAANGLS